MEHFKESWTSESLGKLKIAVFIILIISQFSYLFMDEDLFLFYSIGVIFVLTILEFLRKRYSNYGVYMQSLYTNVQELADGVKTPEDVQSLESFYKEFSAGVYITPYYQKLFKESINNAKSKV